MESEDNIVTNKHTAKLTYLSRYDHITEFFSDYWQLIIFYSVASFAVFWGVIEATSFFLKDENLSSKYVLGAGVILSIFTAFSRTIFGYKNKVPVGLEKETKKAHKIAISKQPFWEYALIYELIKNRTKETDEKLDDVIKNRVLIKVEKKLKINDYSPWVMPRLDNMFRIIETAKQLFVFDLFNTEKFVVNGKENFKSLIKTVNLIQNFYEELYEFEIERRKITPPKGFEVLHELQSDWVLPIKDGYEQALVLLESLSNRNKESKEVVHGNIVFEAPPRIDEYCQEIERLTLQLPKLLAEEEE